MSDEHSSVGARFIAPSGQHLIKVDSSHFEGVMNQAPTSCELDAEGHCITCSDEALPVKVLSVDAEIGLALVMLRDETEEIDITLVEGVVPGDMLLVHGGVAIAHLGEGNEE
jgi:hydrogenase maturation factor